MPIALSSLTPDQIRMLLRLEDGPEEESVGIEIGDLKGHDVRTMDALHAKGLVKLHSGRRITFWFRPTPEGRQIRKYGQTR